MTHKPVARRILVIEDYPDGAETFRRLLQMWGHEVEIAKTGEEGLQMIRDLHPEIVLCDWWLPGIGGKQVAEAVRSDPAVAATFMACVTASADEYVEERALAAGFDVHLVKPVELDELQGLLEGVAGSVGRG